MPMATPEHDGPSAVDISQSLVPLRDRFTSVSALRGLLVLLPVLAWQLVPSIRSVPTREALLSVGAYTALFVASLGLLATGRGAVRRALQIGGLVDGVWLIWAFHLEGGMRGIVPYLFVLQVAGTTLLSSFRSGAKVALWDTLLLYAAAAAASERLLGAGRYPDTATVLPFLAVLVAAALLVAAFAAVNERELRRRRNDVEVLHHLAARLERAIDLTTVADDLCRLACDELDAERAVLVVAPDRARAQARAPTMVRWRTRAGEADARSTLPVGFGPDVLRAIERRQTLRQLWVAGPPDPLLARLVPDCERAVVVPMWLEAGAVGVLVLDYTGGRSAVARLAARLGHSRSFPTFAGAAGQLLGTWVARSPSWKVGRHRKLEERQVATAEQACAHGALALDRAWTMAELARVAAVDPLTGLANRLSLDRALEGIVAAGIPYCVAILDLDHFKALNDTAGHDVGDAALVNVASAIRGAARLGDVPGRLGGEEFLVVMPNVDDRPAVEICERMRAAVDRLPEPRVTVSIGLARGVPGAASYRATIKAADRALYEAKRSGRNRVVVDWATFGATDDGSKITSR